MYVAIETRNGALQHAALRKTLDLAVEAALDMVDLEAARNPGEPPHKCRERLGIALSGAPSLVELGDFAWSVGRVCDMGPLKGVR